MLNRGALSSATIRGRGWGSAWKSGYGTEGGGGWRWAAETAPPPVEHRADGGVRPPTSAMTAAEGGAGEQRADKGGGR